jgi:hypothetical protein
VVGAEEGSGADNSGSSSRRRGSLLVRTKGGERIEVEAVAALSRTTTVIIWGAGEAGFSSMKRSWGKKSHFPLKLWPCFVTVFMFYEKLYQLRKTWSDDLTQFLGLEQRSVWYTL